MSKLFSEDRKHNSLALALLSSFGVCLIGGILWAILYEIGFFASFIAFITVLVAMIVYNKFYKINWIFYLWVGIWVILLNMVLMLVADAIYISFEMLVGFGTAFRLLCELIGSNAEIQSTLLSNAIWTIIFTIIGLVLAIRTLQRERKQNAIIEAQNHDNGTNSSSEPENNQSDLNEKFNTTLSALKSVLNEYETDPTKDKDRFNNNIKTFSGTYLANLTIVEKTYFKSKISELCDEKTTLTEDLSALKVMDRLF